MGKRIIRANDPFPFSFNQHADSYVTIESKGEYDIIQN